MDIFTKAKRSDVMSQIKGHNTTPDREVRSIIHCCGYRFRLHQKNLPGKPDIVLPKYHAVIFVHGCFWHHHPGCKLAYTPKSRVKFWTQKLHENVERDKTVRRQLRNLGWRFLIIWECQINDKNKLVKRIDGFLKSSIKSECGR
jgi:DNA mismatch endonuclease (patch repair protein)